MAKAMSVIAKYREFLSGRIDTDTILYRLLAKTILSKKEMDEVKNQSTIWQKNERLLDYIIEKDESDEFINTLLDAGQSHLANYLQNDGVRRRDLLEEWPLEETEIKIIDVNYGSLIDLIDMGGGLLDKLMSRRVINNRQKQLICSKATETEMNAAFLDILRCGSKNDYKHTIQCLVDSNQGHIGEILDQGGAVLKVHTVLQEPSAEIRLAERITNLLRGKTTEESDRILGMVRDKVISVKTGQSIIFYYYFKTLQSWQELKNDIRTGILKCNIEELCRRADSHTDVVIEQIHIEDEDEENIEKYFASKVNYSSGMRQYGLDEITTKDAGNTQELEDMTTCCICAEVYTDPKALPCIHTFCLKCLQRSGLKTNKGPGDEMPCPLCRRLFKIPAEGFHGLKKNFFIESLIKTIASYQSASSAALCDVCSDENKEETCTCIDIPAADTYCVHCKLKLCEECHKQHKILKFTKNHTLISIMEHERGQNVITNLSPSACEQHEEKVLDIYCADCKMVVCAICFIEDHKLHEGSHVSKFADGFRKTIESNSEAINEWASQAAKKKDEIVIERQNIELRVKSLERDVENRRDALKQLTDKQAISLLQRLYSIRHGRLKDMQMETGDIDAYLSSLENYNSYCKRITARGVDSDFCRAFSDLSARAVELQQQFERIIERELRSLSISFKKSEFEKFLGEYLDNNFNLIGEIEEEGDSKPKKRGKETISEEQSNEIDQQSTEIKIEKRDTESLQLANEQLRKNLDNETQVNKSLAEELSKDKANYNAHIEHMKLEFDNIKTANRTLHGNIDKLKHELVKEKFSSNSSRIDIDKLKRELDKDKRANHSLQENNDKLNGELDAAKRINHSLQSTNDRLKQELDRKQNANITLKASNIKLKQELNSEKMTNNLLQIKCNKLKKEIDQEKIAKSSPEAASRKCVQSENLYKTTIFVSRFHDHTKKYGQEPLQTINDKLRQELDTEILTKNLLQTKCDKLKEELDQAKLAIIFPEATSIKPVQRVNLYKTTIFVSRFQGHAKKSKQKSLKPDVSLYKSDPVFVQAIKTKLAREETRAIYGLTILDSELFVLSDKSAELEIYNSMTLCFIRRWTLKGLTNPMDIGSCNRNKCLYIFNYKGPSTRNEILRIDPNGNLIITWSTGDDYGWSLSVTDDSTIIFAVYEKYKLNEYFPNGQLFRAINLSSCAGICHLWHAIKITTGNFLISYGAYGTDLHRVCVVDADGNLKKSFGGKGEPRIEQMNIPIHLSVDKNGFVIVADRKNSRVLLLDSELKLKREILSKNEIHGIDLRHPQRVLLDESNGRLFVCDNKLNFDGRVLIFNFK